MQTVLLKTWWWVEDADRNIIPLLLQKPLKVNVMLMQVAEPVDGYKVRLCFEMSVIVLLCKKCLLYSHRHTPV